MQLLDEVPMVWGTSYMIYCMHIVSENYNNKDKLCINGADVLKDRNTTIRKQKPELAEKQQIHKKNYGRFSMNLHFRVRVQKTYCDGHTDKVVCTISCSFW